MTAVEAPVLTPHGIVDLHSHLPMHMEASLRGAALRAMTTHHGRGRITLGDRIRAAILDFACHLSNYKTFESGPAVTVRSLRAGHVGVALSVLYQPFDEMDIEHGFHAPLRESYFTDLLAELEDVEARVRLTHGDEAVFVRGPSDLRKALSERKLALIHAVEGGFHFGGTPALIEKNVAEMARRGLGYITVAHLFYRGIATNAPALPFLSDATYRCLFEEPDIGLSPLGEALIESMLRHHVVVDVTHMSEASVWQTLELIPEGVPLFATHAACRQHLAYNLTDEMIAAIAKHDGVIGTILCEYYATDGAPSRPTNFKESVQVLIGQIDHIRKVTDSDDHVAIGTDLDGFIKPTLPGLDSASCLVKLEEALVAHYGLDLATKICSGNALKVLEGYWLGAEGTP